MTLRLLAEDEGDLQLISASMQDAVGKVGDIAYDPAARTLTAAFNRFRWEGERRRERVRTALQIASVLSVRSRNLRLEARHAVIELLAIRFAPAAEPPGGVLSLILAGDGEICLEVEALDVLLADVSDAWPARRTPAHDL